jgi:hypothetical protein
MPKSSSNGIIGLIASAELIFTVLKLEVWLASKFDYGEIFEFD